MFGHSPALVIHLNLFGFSITIALKHLLLNPGIMEDFGRNIEKKIQKDFTLERMVRETEKLYSAK